VKVFTVVGNRPQFIKAAPLSGALLAAGVDEVVLHTGQHWYHVLSQVFFDQLGLAEPRYRLDLHTSNVGAMQPAIAERIASEEPDLVLVYGDTNSTLAGALAAADASTPLAHVEAGLRSGDLSMPEERNRIEVDRIAQLLLVPVHRSNFSGIARRVEPQNQTLGCRISLEGLHGELAHTPQIHRRKVDRPALGVQLGVVKDLVQCLKKAVGGLASYLY